MWTRGLERRVIFVDDDDRADLRRRLSAVLPACGARCFAWAFLSNHVHLILQTGEVPIGVAMKRVMTGFVLRFNARHQRVGYLLQGRFGSRLVTTNPDLMQLVRYVHLNPLRAGLVPDLPALATYEWCGHSALMGRRGSFAFESSRDALALFGRDAERATECLSRWMERSDARSEIPAPADPDSSPDLGRLIRSTCEALGVSEEALLSGARASPVSRARAMICYAAVSELGIPARTVARRLGITPGAVSQSRERARAWARSEKLNT